MTDAEKLAPLLDDLTAALDAPAETGPVFIGPAGDVDDDSTGTYGGALRRMRANAAALGHDVTFTVEPGSVAIALVRDGVEAASATVLHPEILG